MSVESLLIFISASFFLCIAPGPDNLFVLVQSSLYGRRTGLLITFGLCSGLVVHTLAVIAGVAAFFQGSALAFWLLKMCGAMYLLFLAWQSFTTAPPDSEVSREKFISPLQLYLRGVLMNVTNPKVTLFFLAFLPQFVSLGNTPESIQLAILGLTFIATALVVFACVAMLAASLSRYILGSEAMQKHLNRLSGMVFIALAAHLLSGVSTSEAVS